MICLPQASLIASAYRYLKNDGDNNNNKGDGEHSNKNSENDGCDDNGAEKTKKGCEKDARHSGNGVKRIESAPNAKRSKNDPKKTCQTLRAQK